MQPSNGHSGSKAVLVAGSGDPELARLLSILDAGGCRVLVARTVRHAASLLSAASVVICEDRLPDGTWRDLLEAVHHVHSPPALLVTSPLAGPRLWAEVLNAGGYDVLAQPFAAEEVLWSVQRAHETGRPPLARRNEQAGAGLAAVPAALPEIGHRCALLGIETRRLPPEAPVGATG